MNRKGNVNMPDRFIVVFDKKLNQLDVSFSREFDKKIGMKLFKVMYAYFPTSKYPKRDFLFEIKQQRVANQDSMINIFKHFENQE